MHREDRTLLTPHYVVLLLAAIAGCGLYQAVAIRTNADVAWYLYAGGQILDGARLGEDIVEVNAPLVIVLSMGIEGLARLIGVSATALFPWLITVLSCMSLAVCAPLSRPWSANVRQWFLIGLAFVLLIDVGGMLGQREHLLVILVMPYFCSLVREADGRPMRPSAAALVGIAAAIGFGLKPFFLPAWVGLEAYLLVRRGASALCRAQFVAMLAAFLIYAAGVLIWTPDYITFAIESLSLYRAYQPYGDVPVVLSRSFGFVLFAIAFALYFGRSFARSLIDLGAILATMLSIAVLLQGKGWHYQWYSAAALAVILVVVTTGALATRLRFITPAGAQGIAALIVMMLALRTYGFWTIDAPERSEVDALVRRHAAGEAILAFSSHLHVGFPLVNETNVRWASRYPTMWQLPAFCGEATAASCRSQQRTFLDAVLADFISARPAMLIVDSVPPTPSLAGFDYLGYFSRDPRLASALSEYRFLKEIGRYRVFLRSDWKCSGSGNGPLVMAPEHR